MKKIIFGIFMFLFGMAIALAGTLIIENINYIAFQICLFSGCLLALLGIIFLTIGVAKK